MSSADGQCRHGRHRSPSLPQSLTGKASGISLFSSAQYRRDHQRIPARKLAFHVGCAAAAATVLVSTGSLAATNSVAAGTTPLTAQVTSMAGFSSTASSALDTHVAPSLSKNLNVALAETSGVAATVPDQAADALSEVAELAGSTGAVVADSAAPVDVEEVESTPREDSQTSASRSSSRSKTSSTGYAAPITGAPITSGYAMRWGRMHNGLDFGAPTGQPLHAVGAGTVTTGYSPNGLGINVRILLDDGTEVTYGHMSERLVVNGERVEAGDVVGLVGNTGRSFGAHLHFEVRMPGGERVNPSPWLAQQGLL